MRNRAIVLTTVAALALGAPGARAQHAQLEVGDCGGSWTATWTCASNAGSAFVMVASFIATEEVHPIAQESLVEFLFDFRTSAPDWWRIGVGECRLPQSLSVEFSTARGGTSCADFFGAVPGGVTGSYEYRTGPLDAGVMAGGALAANEARLVVRSSVDSVAAVLQSAWPEPGDQVFLFNLAVNKSRTAGTGACAGCTTPACVFVRSLSIQQPAPRGPRGWSSSGGPMVLLQGGPTDLSCIVPTNRSTWGQVKSLYR